MHHDCQAGPLVIGAHNNFTRTHEAIRLRRMITRPTGQRVKLLAPPPQPILEIVSGRTIRRGAGPDFSGQRLLAIASHIPFPFGQGASLRSAKNGSFDEPHHAIELDRLCHGVTCASEELEFAALRAARTLHKGQGTGLPDGLYEALGAPLTRLT